MPTPQRTSSVLRTRRTTSISENEARQSSPALKGGYILFFLLLGVVVMKDVLDMIVSIFDLLGLTVIMAPLSIFFEFGLKVFTIFVNATVMFYFWYTGGKLALRFVIMSIGAIIDAIPILNILPLSTLTFVLAFMAGRVLTKVSSTALGSLGASIVAKKI